MDLCLPSSPDHFSAILPLASGVFQVQFRSTTLAAKISDLEEVTDTDIDNVLTGIRFGRSLRHRNLLPLVTAFLHRSSLWSISPYCDLHSASDLCKPFGLSELLICAVARDTLKALDYLHNRGIIHRGICGAHLLIRSDGRCFLSGLNYATSVIKNGLWRTSLHDFPLSAKKNLIFLAPEILEQNLLGYNHKSDIYSLGVMCCELANGIVPYWNLDPAEMLLDKLTGNHAKPIDSTCAKYIQVAGELTSEDRQRFEVYKSRRFSDEFHTFCVSLCLIADPHKRPSAQQLLSHRFVKQLKKISMRELFASMHHGVTEDHKRNSGSFEFQNTEKGHHKHDIEWNF